MTTFVAVIYSIKYEASKFDPPKTPYQRLIDSPNITSARKKYLIDSFYSLGSLLTSKKHKEKNQNHSQTL